LWSQPLAVPDVVRGGGAVVWQAACWLAWRERDVIGQKRNPVGCQARGPAA
jgi:hypothetical protein